MKTNKPLKIKKSFLFFNDIEEARLFIETDEYKKICGLTDRLKIFDKLGT
jgi:hypothetical protein